MDGSKSSDPSSVSFHPIRARLFWSFIVQVLIPLLSIYSIYSLWGQNIPDDHINLFFILRARYIYLGRHVLGLGYLQPWFKRTNFLINRPNKKRSIRTIVMGGPGCCLQVLSGSAVPDSTFLLSWMSIEDRIFSFFYGWTLEISGPLYITILEYSLQNIFQYRWAFSPSESNICFDFHFSRLSPFTFGYCSSKWNDILSTRVISFATSHTYSQPKIDAQLITKWLEVSVGIYMTDKPKISTCD